MTHEQQQALAAAVARCAAGGTAEAALNDAVLNEDTVAALAELPAGALRLRLLVSAPDAAVLDSADRVLACGNVAVELQLGAAWEALLPAAVKLMPQRLRLPNTAPPAVRRGVDRLYNSGRLARSAAWLAGSGEDSAALLAAVGMPDDAASAEAWLAQQFSDDALHDALLADRVAAGTAVLTPEARALCRLADTDPRFQAPVPEARCAAVASDGVLLYADRTVRHPVTGAYEVRCFTPACLSRPWQQVLFDLDGTITDPAQGITRAVQHALRHFGIDEPHPANLLRFIGPPLLDSFRQFYGLTDEQARTALRVYREYYAVRGIYECALYDGMTRLLRDAHRQGYRVMMATSKPELYARRLMRHFGLTPFFACLAGADMAEQRADKAAVIRYALLREGVTDPSTAVMVGDRRFDMEGGRACGLHTVGVSYGYGTREELQAAGAEAVVNSVDELYRLLLPAVPAK